MRGLEQITYRGVKIRGLVGISPTLNSLFWFVPTALLFWLSLPTLITLGSSHLDSCTLVYHWWLMNVLNRLGSILLFYFIYFISWNCWCTVNEFRAWDGIKRGLSGHQNINMLHNRSKNPQGGMVTHLKSHLVQAITVTRVYIKTHFKNLLKPLSPIILCNAFW